MVELKNETIVYSDVCRCCLQENKDNNFLGLWDKYLYNGNVEVYGDMIIECFFMPWAQPDNRETIELICVKCVSKVCDAFSFKKQLQAVDLQLASRIRGEVTRVARPIINHLLTNNLRIKDEEILENDQVTLEVHIDGYEHKCGTAPDTLKHNVGPHDESNELNALRPVNKKKRLIDRKTNREMLQFPEQRPHVTPSSDSSQSTQQLQGAGDVMDTDSRSKSNQRYFKSVCVNNKDALRKERDRRYRDKNLDKINQRRRENRRNRRRELMARSNVGHQHEDTCTQRAECDALGKERNQKHRQGHREEIYQRKKEGRQEKPTVEELVRVLEGDKETEIFESEDEVDYDEEDNLQDTREINLFDWTTQISTPVVEQFDQQFAGVSPSTPLNIDTPESEYFEFFCDRTLVADIVNFTNLFHRHYSRHTVHRIYARLHKWQDVTDKDIYIFLAATMVLSRNQHKSIDRQWSTDPLLNSPIFHNMYRDRYTSILAMLTFSEVTPVVDSESKLLKTKMIIEHARQKFKTTFFPNSKVRIDNNIVPFRGRLFLKRYLPERNEFPIKLAVLCDVETGYIVDFIVHCASETEMEVVPNLGISESVVNELMKQYNGCYRQLFVNEEYASPYLFLYLRQKDTYACGPVDNRQDMPKFNELDSGEIEAFSSPPLLALKWKDEKAVTMLSTMHDDRLTSSNMGNTVLKPKPQCFEDYTNSVRSNESSDMMMSTLGCIRKSRKWYKKLAFHIIDMMLLNSFYLYRIIKKKPDLRFADFQLAVIRQLVEKNQYVSTIETFASSSHTLDPKCLESNTLNHFPTKIPSGKSQRCKLCAMNKKRSETRFMCKICNVYLCIDPCAVKYHQKEQTWTSST